ncbi:MAG TPA: SIMPL domain-containing protein [Candidatus Paceibacterota bacterium]|nr:SIMPL domain-containing protein [Candidatus Paceibacterota bacterium]
MENTREKKYFWFLLDVLLAVVIIGVSFVVTPAIQKFGDSMSPARTLVVSGEGKTTVSPDIAEVSFSVVSQGTNPQNLAAANNDKMTAVINNIKSNGVDAKDITTTSYNLQPNYSYDKNTGRSYIYNYTLTQTVSVKIRDLSKVADVIGGVVPLGVNQMGSVSFQIDDPEKVIGQAREDAYNQAKEKAQAIAAASGVKLGRIISINEYQNTPMPYYKNVSALGMGGAASQVSVPSIEPGSQELTLNVSVTYSLE